MTNTIAPQVGKRYKLRNGMITQPLQLEDGEFCTDARIDDYYPMWTLSGRVSFWAADGDDWDGESALRTPGQSIYDIIGEYTE